MDIKWISVKERLPVVNTEVVINVDDCYMAVGYINADGDWWENFCGLVSGEVTHWLPIPELPKRKDA